MMTDYYFYTNDYMGESIPGAEFPRFARRAAEQLAQYKRRYTVTTPEENAESMAICAMADALYYFEAAQNGADSTIGSMSIGSVSVSYADTGVDLTAAGQAKELYRCACRYLDIYRGCGGCSA